MTRHKVGVIHPGEMGVVVAATIRNSGHEVFFASQGRSRDTLQRAAGAGLTDAGTVARLCAICSAIVSVCPPEFAEPVAEEVAGLGYRGLYVDANATAPERARRIGERLAAHRAAFVDACIIGMPAGARGQTWLYASGEHAPAAAALFGGGPLEFEALEGPAGQASALKMCFAAHSKGTAALLAAVVSAAEHLGVRAALERQWSRNGPNVERAMASIQQAAPKAWRFVAEMGEIAGTFASTGVPAGFPAAAEEIYRKLAPFKGRRDAALAEVLEKLAGE